jgi:hypothetical protein
LDSLHANTVAPSIGPIALASDAPDVARPFTEPRTDLLQELDTNTLTDVKPTTLPRNVNPTNIITTIHICAVITLYGAVVWTFPSTTKWHSFWLTSIVSFSVSLSIPYPYITQEKLLDLDTLTDVVISDVIFVGDKIISVLFIDFPDVITGDALIPPAMSTDHGIRR